MKQNKNKPSCLNCGRHGRCSVAFGSEYCHHIYAINKKIEERENMSLNFLAQKIKPLPCPFCGSEAEAYSDEINDRVTYVVGCSGDDCPLESANTAPHARLSEAIKTWNRRGAV